MKGNSSVRSDDEIIWELSIVLIEADSKDDAEATAAAIGKAAEVEYVSMTDETITWTFEQVESVFQIGERVGHGVEIYSQFLRASTVKALLAPFDD